MNPIDAGLLSYGVLWALVVFNSVLLIATLRSLGLVLTRLPQHGALVIQDVGPRVGQSIAVPEGQRVFSDPKVARMLIVFLSTGCSLCRTIAPSLGSLRQPDVQPLVLIRGDGDERGSLLRLLGPGAEAFTRPDDSAGTALGINITPFALVVDRTQTVIAKGLVNTLEQLESLLEVPVSRRIST